MLGVCGKQVIINKVGRRILRPLPFFIGIVRLRWRVSSHEAERKLHTISSLSADLRACGLQAGMTVLMHCSLKQVGGWICGGAEALIQALLQVLGEDGTLMMPTQTSNNTDPEFWMAPPVPSAWWQSIRDEYPAYDPAVSVTIKMGVVAETFRKLPQVRRSAHPIASFAACGKHADALLAVHTLEDMLGETSPLGRLYALNGVSFFIGTGHETNTALHLAEHRAHYVGKRLIPESSAILRDGVRVRVNYDILDYDDSDFGRLGADYEAQHHPVIYGKLGEATTRLLPVRPMVDFAQHWFSTQRGVSA